MAVSGKVWFNGLQVGNNNSCLWDVDAYMITSYAACSPSALARVAALRRRSTEEKVGSITGSSPLGSLVGVGEAMAREEMGTPEVEGEILFLCLRFPF